MNQAVHLATLAAFGCAVLKESQDPAMFLKLIGCLSLTNPPREPPPLHWDCAGAGIIDYLV